MILDIKTERQIIIMYDKIYKLAEVINIYDKHEEEHCVFVPKLKMYVICLVALFSLQFLLKIDRYLVNADDKASM